MPSSLALVAIASTVLLLATGAHGRGVVAAATDEDRRAEAEAAFATWAQENGTPLDFVSCDIAPEIATCYGVTTAGDVLAAQSPVTPTDEFEFSIGGALTPAVTTDSTVLAGQGPVTVVELNSVLGPAATAYMLDPSPETETALKLAAQHLLDSGRPLPNDLAYEHSEDHPNLFSSSPAELLTYIVGTQRDAESDTFEDFVGYLRALRLELPFILPLGSHLVNSEVPPGTYRALWAADCFWATLDDAGNTLDSNYVPSAPQVMMVVRASDYAVNNGCGTMILIEPA